MASKHSRAKVAPVRVGPFEIQGLMDSDGNFYVGASQAADLFQLDQSQASRTLRRLMGDGFEFECVASELNPKSVNALSLQEFALLCYRLSVAGKDSTGKATRIAHEYFTESGDAEKVSILDGLRALEKSNHKALKARTSAQRERDVQEKYSVLWRCEKEYPVELMRMAGTFPLDPVLIGRADLVSNRLVAEIKECCQWKHAMGQLLAYQEVLQRPEIWLILFNSKNQPQKAIEHVVSRLGIKVKFVRN